MLKHVPPACHTEYISRQDSIGRTGSSQAWERSQASRKSHDSSQPPEAMAPRTCTFLTSLGSTRCVTPISHLPGSTWLSCVALPLCMMHGTCAGEGQALMQYSMLDKKHVTPAAGQCMPLRLNICVYAHVSLSLQPTEIRLAQHADQHRVHSRMGSSPTCRRCCS